MIEFHGVAPIGGHPVDDDVRVEVAYKVVLSHQRELVQVEPDLLRPAACPMDDSGEEPARITHAVVLHDTTRHRRTADLVAQVAGFVLDEERCFGGPLIHVVRIVIDPTHLQDLEVEVRLRLGPVVPVEGDHAGAALAAERRELPVVDDPAPKLCGREGPLGRNRSRLGRVQPGEGRRRGRVGDRPGLVDMPLIPGRGDEVHPRGLQERHGLRNRAVGGRCVPS